MIITWRDSRNATGNTGGAVVRYHCRHCGVEVAVTYSPGEAAEAHRQLYCHENFCVADVPKAVARAFDEVPDEGFQQAAGAA